MVIAAWIALYKDDLKALLAFSTVSHLGLITMLFGMGTPIAAVAAVFHILNHCTFKAALFLCAGIVDHETGTRDAQPPGRPALADADHRHAGHGRRRLDGRPAAAQRLPLQGDDARGRGAHRLSGLALAGAGARDRWARCCRSPTRSASSPPSSSGRTRDDYPHHPHDPPPGMWLPVAVLVVPGRADRRGAGPGRAAGRPRRRCRRRRTAARLPSGALARR